MNQPLTWCEANGARLRAVYSSYHTKNSDVFFCNTNKGDYLLTFMKGGVAHSERIVVPDLYKDPQTFNYYGEKGPVRPSKS